MLLPLFSVTLKARKAPTQAPTLDPGEMPAAALRPSSGRESSRKPDLAPPVQPQPVSSAASVQSLSHPSSRDIVASASALGPKGSSSSFLTLETTAEPVLFTQVPQPAPPPASLSCSQISPEHRTCRLPAPAPKPAAALEASSPSPVTPFFNIFKLHILQGLFYDIKYTYNLILRSFYIVQVSILSKWY